MVAPLAERWGDGLAPVYDRYAPALHAYCRSLLGEPADADDAVLDTFIIADAELDGLRDPGQLRPWLYAVARNECRHRLRSRALAAEPDTANELTDETVDLAADAERAQLRAATGAALAGLGASDREIIELNLRHDLGGQDLADVLGVSVSQADALVSRARARFEASLGALLIARTGQESCPELAAMLSRWDGQLNVLLRKRINRHTEHCEQCSDRWRHELNPAMLLSMLPVALPPPGLRDQLFYLIDDMGPAASAYRTGVIHRAGPFGWSGFPEPLDPPHGDHRRKTPGRGRRGCGPGRVRGRGHVRLRRAPAACGGFRGRRRCDALRRGPDAVGPARGHGQVEAPRPQLAPGVHLPQCPVGFGDRTDEPDRPLPAAVRF